MIRSSLILPFARLALILVAGLLPFPAFARNTANINFKAQPLYTGTFGNSG